MAKPLSKSELSKSDYEALANFRYTLRRFLKFSESVAREAGLTPQQHQLLLAIRGRPLRDWASVGELAEALQVAHHAAVRLVDRCEKAGWVAREPNPKDRRLVRVTLTPSGEEILAGLSRRHRLELKSLRQALQLSFLEEVE